MLPTVGDIVAELCELSEVDLCAFTIAECITKEIPVSEDDIGEVLNPVEFLIRLAHVHDCHGGSQHLASPFEGVLVQVTFNSPMEPIVMELLPQRSFDFAVRGVQKIQEEMICIRVDVFMVADGCSLCYYSLRRATGSADDSTAGL